MTIPFRLIPEYIDRLGIVSIQLFSVDWVPIRVVSRDEALRLAELEAVCGIGTPTRLHKLQLIVPESEIDRRAAERARAVRAERPLAPLELLRRMCSDRKFVYRQRLTVVRNGDTKAVWIWQHKPVGGRRILRRPILAASAAS